MKHIYAALLLCNCTTVEIVPAEGGGGSTPDATGGAAAIPGEGGNGGGGSGGEPSTRTIVVDLIAPEGADRDAVVVLVSAPDGSVSETLLGSDLPATVAADDGDLVTYAYTGTSWSHAETVRVTPQVAEVRTRAGIGVAEVPCQVGEPMTLILEVSEVADANVYELRLAGARIFTSQQLDPGSNEVEVRACPGTMSFDLVLVAKEFSNTDALAVARVDAIPFMAGSSTSMPILLSTERELVDIVVEGDPGTSFGAMTWWFNDAFGFTSYSVDTTQTHTIGEDGTASLSDGPFALGAGNQRVTVSVPPPYFSCEIDLAWKVAPFDGTPLHARFGSLATFAPQADGNVALAPEGEVGDVMLRTENEYASDVTAHWVLYEDPTAPYPLPVKPEIPEDLLPDFKWPAPSAELRYIHHDFGPTEGYADYASTAPSEVDGRSLHRVPAGCF